MDPDFSSNKKVTEDTMIVKKNQKKTVNYDSMDSICKCPEESLNEKKVVTPVSVYDNIVINRLSVESN